jgi:hypothetical protein
LKSADVLEEHVASIFRVDEKTEQEKRVKTGGKQSFHTGSQFDLFFYPEDGGDMFLRNVG